MHNKNIGFCLLFSLHTKNANLQLLLQLLFIPSLFQPKYELNTCKKLLICILHIPTFQLMCVVAHLWHGGCGIIYNDVNNICMI